MSREDAVPEHQERVQREVEEVVRLLSELTGLPSRWSGRVELIQDPRVLGRKPFGCDIHLHERLADLPVRWRTLIHEALHSFSVGYSRNDYETCRGWEEGVVEQLQRLLRPAILERLGISVKEQIFQEIEAEHAFNEFITALEQLRVALKREDATGFYSDLLATPIADRQGSMFRQGNHLAGRERIRFFDVFSASNAVLKDQTRGRL